jgi:hypothetical protein
MVRRKLVVTLVSLHSFVTSCTERDGRKERREAIKTGIKEKK